MKNLRVLHVLDHSLPLASGYSVRSHSLLRGQRSWGVDASGVTSPVQGAGPDAEVIDDVEYRRVPSWPGDARVPSPLREVRRMARLARRLEREVPAGRIDCLHAHSPVLNGLPALWTARRHRLPFVYEVRALWEDAAAARSPQTARSVRYRSIRTLETFLMRRADAVVLISRGLFDDAARRGVAPSRLFHVPNGVDTAAFHPAPADEGLVRQWDLAGKVVFGFIGTLARHEGLDILLRAFAELLAKIPQARLVLVGEGEARAHLRRDARLLGVASQTLFVGAVPHSQARRWYAVCDALVYPRRSSRLTELVTPLKPLEAMAMGKLVLGSDVGGLRELVRDGRTGRLFPPGEPEALAHVLADVARRPSDHTGLVEAARRWVCAERDWTRVTRIYGDVYAHAQGAARTTPAASGSA